MRYVANCHEIIFCSIPKINVQEEVMRVMEPQMAPKHLVIEYHSKWCSPGDICKSKLVVMMTEMVMISCDSALTLLDQQIEVHKVILPASSPVVIMIVIGCFTITVKSNYSSFMTFIDVMTFPVSVLCITGWDKYVFSHESSETVKNIYFQSVCSVGWLFWAKKTFFSVFDPNWSKSFRNGPKWSKTVRHHFWTNWDRFWIIHKVWFTIVFVHEEIARAIGKCNETS